MTELEKKINFTKDLNDAIVKVQTNIDNVEYQAYGKDGRIYYEFLVVNYKGGAMSVRNCTASSCAVIFEELAKLLQHGYYSEIEWYESTASRFERMYK